MVILDSAPKGLVHIEHCQPHPTYGYLDIWIFLMTLLNRSLARILGLSLGLSFITMPLLAATIVVLPEPFFVTTSSSVSPLDRGLNPTAAHTDTEEDDIMDKVLAPNPVYTEQDKLYKYNHAVYTFNSKLDKYVLKPVAKTYAYIIPSFIRTGVTNFFNNLSEIPTVINDVLQLDIYQGLADSWRFVFNTTLGIGGLFDIAQYTGLEPHQNDLGITFAQWGWKDSGYFVIPLLGPSTIRDAVSLPINTVMTIWLYVPWYVGYPGFALDITSIRANQLPADPILKQLAVDPYNFLRDAYMQHRNYQIGIEGNMSIDTDPYVLTDAYGNPSVRRPEKKIPVGGAVGQALLQ